MNTRETTETRLTPAQRALSDLWDEHVGNEFATKEVEGWETRFDEDADHLVDTP